MYAIQERYGDRYFAGWEQSFSHESIIKWNKMNEGYICCWYRQSMAIEYMKYWCKFFSEELYEVVKI